MFLKYPSNVIFKGRTITFMNQELEIEFKNMLTSDEYDQILKSEFGDDAKRMIMQSNYYFDTIDEVLKKQNSALRIRKTDSFNEMTLKVPSQGFLLETNLSLSDNKCSEILETKQMKLSDEMLLDGEVKQISKDTDFYLFNSFETKRFEKQMGDHLVVLDQTTFQNGVTDYEVELESTEAVAGKKFFESFLAKNGIPIRPASPKIARAVKNKQPFS